MCRVRGWLQESLWYFQCNETKLWPTYCITLQFPWSLLTSPGPYCWIPSIPILNQFPGTPKKEYEIISIQHSVKTSESLVKSTKSLKYIFLILKKRISVTGNYRPSMKRKWALLTFNLILSFRKHVLSILKYKCKIVELMLNDNFS